MLTRPGIFCSMVVSKNYAVAAETLGICIHFGVLAPRGMVRMVLVIVSGWWFQPTIVVNILLIIVNIWSLDGQ